MFFQGICTESCFGRVTNYFSPEKRLQRSPVAALTALKPLNFTPKGMSVALIRSNSGVFVCLTSSRLQLGHLGAACLHLDRQLPALKGLGNLILT